MSHILEGLTHKMEGQPPQKRGQLGSRYECMYVYIYISPKIHWRISPGSLAGWDFGDFFCG